MKPLAAIILQLVTLPPFSSPFCQLWSAFGIVFVRTQTVKLKKRQFLSLCFGLQLELSSLLLLVSFCKKLYTNSWICKQCLLPCRMCHFQAIQFGVWFEFCWICFHNFDRGLGHDWKFFLHLCCQVSQRFYCESDFMYVKSIFVNLNSQKPHILVSRNIIWLSINSSILTVW